MSYGFNPLIAFQVYEPNEPKERRSPGMGGVLSAKGHGFTTYEDDDEEIYGPIPDTETLKSL